MKLTLYFKCLAVIDSCKTTDQLQVARKYLKAAEMILTPLSYAFIMQELADKALTFMEEEHGACEIQSVTTPSALV